VTGAYVTVKTSTADGVRVVGLYAGAPWPADADPEATEHHLANGLIAEVGVPAKAEPPPPAAPVERVDPETASHPARAGRKP
jgi:hypothetical protein